MSEKEFKILMLHGHQQSAQIFEPKARYIERAFDNFASDRDFSFSFQYLSGILPAHPDRSNTSDHWVWGYGDPDDGEIKKIELSIQHILDTIDRDGPFIGIAGFSSGAAMAAIIASLLEKKSKAWGSSMEGKTLEMTVLGKIIAVVGFRLGPAYQTIYSPTITTPTLLAIGALDPVIPPDQTRRLAAECQFSTVFEFPGTHYVPQAKEFSAFRKSLADFLANTLKISDGEKGLSLPASGQECAKNERRKQLREKQKEYSPKYCGWEVHTAIQHGGLKC